MAVQARTALVLLAVAVAGSWGSRLAGITAYGPVESVYDWETEHCASGRPLNHQPHPTPYRRDIPDAPAMAWRDPRAGRVFVAPGDSRGTWANVGSSLDSVKHSCDTMIFNYSGVRGYDSDPPSKFSSHEWLYAPYVVPGAENTTVYMLIHNEFHGWDFYPELCNATVMVDGRCWYNAASISVSRDGGLHFEHLLPPPANLVAASRAEYVANVLPRGVFSPGQIVKSPQDGMLYSFPRCRNAIDGASGVCIMRTTVQGLEDPRSWRFWLGHGEDFGGQFADPYTSHGSAPEPAVIPFGGNSSFSSPSQPVTRFLETLGAFVMVGYADMPGAHTHFGYSVSPTPWGPWTSMKPISGVTINPKGDPSNPRGLYPSLLDARSESLNFDTITEDGELWLYWIQGRDKAVVHAPDMARDVVRQRVRLEVEA